MQQNSMKHSLKSVIEHRVLTCHNDTVLHWIGNHGDQTINTDATSLLKAIQEYNSTNEYIDVHSLQFTPSSFKHIIQLLYANNIIDFCCEYIYPTVRNSNEFYAVLKKQSNNKK
jgi:hypothetical protein